MKRRFQHGLLSIRFARGIPLARRLLRIIALTVAISGSVVLLTGAILFALAQTALFNRWLAAIIPSVLRDQLNAELHIQSVHVNIFRGVQLDSVIVIAEADTVVAIPRLNIRYTPEALIFRTIAITTLRLEEPTIKLVRRRDSTWNLEHLFKRSTSSSSEPPSLLLYIRSLELVNGRIVMSDELTTADTSGRFDPLHADIDSVQLHGTILADFRQQHYALALDAFSCFDRRSQWKLLQLQGTLQGDSNAVRIPMATVRFPSSDLVLHNASVHWQDSVLSYRGQVRFAPLSPMDAHHLLPADIRLGRPVFLAADVEGTSQTVQIRNATLEVGGTQLHGNVILHHLSGIEPLMWEVVLHRSQLRWNDLRALLAWLELPPVAALNYCSIAHLSAHGTTDTIQTEFRAQLPAGNVELTAALGLNTSMRYRVMARIQNFDLSQLARELPQTELTGLLSLEGRGTTPATIEARLTALLDSSTVASVPLTAATMQAQIVNGVLTLDTLTATLPAWNGGEVPRLSASGYVAIAPAGDIEATVVCEHLPLDRLTQQRTFPQLFSAQITMRSTGNSLDSLRAAMHAKIDELVFQDRALFPFWLDATFDFDATGRRLLMLQSPQLEAQIRGHYTLPGMMRSIGEHLAFSDTLITQFAAIARGSQTRMLMLPADTIRDSLDATIALRIRSLAFLSPLFAPLALEASGTIVGSIVTNKNRSAIALDTVAIDRLIMSTAGGFYLASMPLQARLHLDYRVYDSVAQLDVARMSLVVDSVLRVGNLRIVRPAIEWQWDGTVLHIRTDTAWLENTVPMFIDATIANEQGIAYRLRIHGLRIGFSDDFSWRNAQPIELFLADGRYTIETAVLRHEQSAATLMASGKIDGNGLDNCRLALRWFNLSHLTAIPTLQNIELIQQLAGYADSLMLAIDGSWEHPRFSIYGTMHSIAYHDVIIGDHDLTFSYDGTNLWGTATISSPLLDGERQTVLDVRIELLPLTFSLMPFNVSLREGSPLKIVAYANQIPLAVIEPFFPAITQIRGTATAELTIGGTLPDHIRFGGAARYDNCEFLVPATNIRYRSRGRLTLDNNVLQLDTIELHNDPADLVGGEAVIRGTVRFQGFQPDTLDIHISIPGDRGFLVMSNATAAVNNTMYGRLVISTEENNRLRQLHLVGTVEQPRFTGFLRVEEADITFPPTTSVTVQTSSFKYQRTGEGYFVTDAVVMPIPEDTSIGDLPPRTGTASSPIRLSITPGFTDRLLTSVDVTIRRQMRIKMDFSSVEQLVAFVEQENRSEYLRFIREGNRRTELRGTLIVDPSSTYKFYSTFAAGGRLRFTTGAIDNPEVDLRAVYDGERIIGADNRRERYRVILLISGTKRQPRVRMTYEINGEEAPGMRGDSVRIMTNALLLVLFGRTQEELTGGNSGSVATTALDQSVNAARSAAVSAFLTNALQGGVIKNVNIDFGSSDVTSLSQARIMLTGQLFGANVTVGGSVADLAQNSQITLDLSIGNALGIEWLRNLIAQFQATANPGQSLSRQQKQWEFRLGWRLP